MIFCTHCSRLRFLQSCDSRIGACRPWKRQNFQTVQCANHTVTAPLNTVSLWFCNCVGLTRKRAVKGLHSVARSAVTLSVVLLLFRVQISLPHLLLKAMCLTPKGHLWSRQGRLLPAQDSEETLLCHQAFCSALRRLAFAAFMEGLGLNTFASKYLII